MRTVAAFHLLYYLLGALAPFLSWLIVLGALYGAARLIADAWRLARALARGARHIWTTLVDTSPG